MEDEEMSMDDQPSPEYGTGENNVIFKFTVS